jgi:hypothetical protein
MGQMRKERRGRESRRRARQQLEVGRCVNENVLDRAFRAQLLALAVTRHTAILIYLIHLE